MAEDRRADFVALDSVPDAVIGVGGDGLVVVANRLAGILFCGGEGELVGCPLGLLVPDAQRPMDQARASFREDPRVRPVNAAVKLRACRRDGTEFVAQISFAPLQTDGGVIVIAAIRDATHAWEAERERDRVLADFQEAQHLAQLGFWRWDPDRETLVWSAGMYEVLGLAEASGPLDTEQFLALMHPEDRERAQQGYARMLRDKHKEPFALDCRLLIGERGPSMVHLIARPDAERPGCYRGTLQDVAGLRASEQARRERSDELAVLIDGAPIGMATAGADGRFEHVNKALCDLLGYSREELLSMTYAAVTHPGDLAGNLAAGKSVIEGQAAPSGQIVKRYVHRDGRTIWAHMTFALVGERIIAQMQDITAERTATEATTLLAEVARSSYDAIITVTLDGEVLTWNAAAERVYGYRAEEMIGKPILSLTPGHGLERQAPSLLERVRGGERIEPFETTRRRKDGSIIDVVLTLSPLRDADGNVVGGSAVARDITEQKRAERELARIRQLLEQAELIAQMGSWEVDLRTHRVTCSAGVYNILKLLPRKTGDADGSGGRWLSNSVHPEDRKYVREALARTISELTDASLEFRVIRADGRVRFLTLQAETIVDQAGKPAHLIGVTRDVTEANHTKEALGAAPSALTKHTQLPERPASAAAPVRQATADALTDRQIEVLRLIADGLTNAEIAQRVFLTESTVKFHVKQILVKTNSANRTEAVVRIFGPDAPKLRHRGPSA